MKCIFVISIFWVLFSGLACSSVKDDVRETVEKLESVAKTITSPETKTPTTDVQIVETVQAYKSSQLLTGQLAKDAIGKARSKMLELLEAETGGLVNITVDSQTNAILFLRLNSPIKRTGDFSKGVQAFDFLKGNLDLIDPHIQLNELVKAENGAQCEGALDQVAGSLNFVREISGKRVIGSNLKIRFDTNGSINQIENALASVRAETIDRTIRTIDLDQAIEKLVDDRRTRASVVDNANAVWVPQYVDSELRLINGNVVVWNGDANNPRGAIVVDSGDVLGPWDVGYDPKSIDHAMTAHLNANTGLPDFISYRSRGGKPIPGLGGWENPGEVAYRFLEQNPAIFHSGNARCQFQIAHMENVNGLDSVSYVRMEQVIAGLRVFGAELIFEIKDGSRIMAVQGHVLPEAPLFLPGDSVLNSEGAESRAIGALNIALGTIAPIEKATATELVIYPGQLNTGEATDSRIAYHVVTGDYAHFIDGFNGQVLLGYPLKSTDSILKDAMGNSESDFPMYETVAKNGVIQTGAPTPPNIDVQGGAIADLVTADNFYSDNYGWDGVNGIGRDWVVNTNVLVSNGGCGARGNAFYLPNGETFFCNGMAVDDVIAHEMAHGVISHSSGLIYLDQSGALNEAYSDIMASVIAPDAVPSGASSPTWKIAESVPNPRGTIGTATCNAMRDMLNPSNCWSGPNTAPTFHPNTFGGYLSRTDLNCTTDGTLDFGPACDNGGVHFNSGIINRAHALMSDGISGTFPGIGRAKMGMLAFDVMSNRLIPWSTMIDSALATRSSCEMMIGSTETDLLAVIETSFVRAECDSVMGAFRQVGLDPDLVSNWLPPVTPFSNTIPRFIGETTSDGCLVNDVIVTMETGSGLLDASVLQNGASPTIAVPGSGSAFVTVTTPPIGTVSKAHVLGWTSNFGVPFWNNITTSVGIDQSVPCSTGSGSMVQLTSPTMIMIHPGPPIGVLPTGLINSPIDSACILDETIVELLNPDGQVIGVTGNSALHTGPLATIAGFPVPGILSATMMSDPPGIPDLSAPVAWAFTPGTVGISWRLRYFVNQPAGVDCIP